MDVRGFVAVLSMAGVFSAVLALQCYKCGQYNDGVGSITPCINSSHMKLSECPSKEHVYCIVSIINITGKFLDLELSQVRYAGSYQFQNATSIAQLL